MGTINAGGGNNATKKDDATHDGKNDGRNGGV
jgi:hypothetical protein